MLCIFLMMVSEVIILSKMKVLGLFLLGIVAVATATEYRSFKGYSVISVEPNTEEQLKWLIEARDTYNLDFWTEPRGVNDTFDLMLSIKEDSEFIQELKTKGIPRVIKITNIQKLIDEQQKEAINPKKPIHPNLRLDHTRYRQLDEIYAALDEFDSSFSYVKVYNAPHTTYEGRNFKVVQISKGDDNSKPIIWMDCGIHAREWVSAATCQYIIDVLTSGDSLAEMLLTKYEFHIMPVVNPDGYHHTWIGDRVWRKNRHPFGFCYGVDPNRNFDSDFGGQGTSNSPCSDIYRGEYAFSEPESQAIRDTVKGMGSRVKAFFSLHSYSQLWMTPYGYTYVQPQNYDEVVRVAKVGVDALTSVHNTHYKYGNIANTIYPAAGGSVDWTYDSLGIEYNYALELRDTGHYGFLLPPEQIIPTGEETYAGIVAAINAMH